MKAETKHSYQKRIKELEAENCKLSNQLYNYRTTALEIFDGIADTCAEGINKNWVLKRLRRCFQ